jgi:hypothetical protein
MQFIKSADFAPLPMIWNVTGMRQFGGKKQAWVSCIRDNPLYKVDNATLIF